MSTASWSKLTPEEQEKFLEIGKTVSEWSYNYTDGLIKEQLKELEEKGMEINDDFDTQLFRDAVSGIYDTYEEKYPELLNLLLSN